MTEQLNNATATPAVPSLPAGYFTDAKVRADHHTATVKVFEAAQATAASAPAVEPNADDLAVISQTRKHLLPDGRPAVLHNPRFAATLEKLHAGVLDGVRLDRAAAQREIHEALGLPVPAAPKAPETPAPPEGSPLDREQARLDALADRIDAGEYVPISELPEAAFSGYSLAALPGDWVMSRADIADLEDARAANLPQSVIDAFLAARIARESAP